MISPIYHVSAEVIRIISEISEQIGVLKTLTTKQTKTDSSPQKLPFDPFSENDFLRAQKKMVDELSTNSGYYRTDDPRVRLHMAMLFDWLNHTDDTSSATLATDFGRPANRTGRYRAPRRILSRNGLFR